MQYTLTVDSGSCYTFRQIPVLKSNTVTRKGSHKQLYHFVCVIFTPITTIVEIFKTFLQYSPTLFGQVFSPIRILEASKILFKHIFFDCFVTRESNTRNCWTRSLTRNNKHISGHAEPEHHRSFPCLTIMKRIVWTNIIITDRISNTDRCA